MTCAAALRRMAMAGLLPLLAGPPAAKADAQPAGRGAPAAAQGKAEAPSPSIQSRRDKLSYAFGVDLARTIQGQKERLNVELLVRALDDALAGRTLLLTAGEVADTLRTFETEVKQDLEHARAMVARRNQQQGETFFAENARKQGVVTLPSGLQYTVLQKGKGKVPAAEDVVLCNYRGTLLDGTEIDSSARRKGRSALAVGKVIPGLSQSLQLMPVGSRWRIFVPPQLAYGDRATPGFGPNSTLVFDVELLSIEERVETPAQAQPARAQR